MRKAIVLVALVVLVPAAAQAASCTISATPDAFGTYIPSKASPTDNTGTVTVTCSAAAQVVQYSIALNAGVNAGGSFSNRRMRNGTSFLSYQLYTNTTHTTVWGNGTGGTGGTATVSDNYSCVLCVNQRRNYLVYGRLPGLQWTASPGFHTDTITATVTFN